MTDSTHLAAFVMLTPCKEGRRFFCQTLFGPVDKNSSPAGLSPLNFDGYLNCFVVHNGGLIRPF